MPKKIDVITPQREMNEILFHIHLDQAAAYLMTMVDTLNFSRESKQDFTAAYKTFKRLWKKQDAIVNLNMQLFEQQSILVNKVLSAFLNCNKPLQMIAMMEEFNRMQQKNDHQQKSN